MNPHCEGLSAFNDWECPHCRAFFFFFFEAERMKNSQVLSLHLDLATNAPMRLDTTSPSEPSIPVVTVHLV